MPRGYPPSLFVSSTCFDLSQVRLDLKRFIDNLGYDAVISESAAFPVNPQTSAIESCINAVRTRADILVLVVGTRYGTVVADRNRSITNLEYLEAKAKRIPIYVFISQQILHTLPVWHQNPGGDYASIVDTPKLFEFADQLLNKSDQWVFPFSEVNDITEKLRSQLAHLFTEALEVRNKLLGLALDEELMNLPAPPLKILLERPPAWEYRFFSAALRAQLAALSQLRWDVRYELRIGPVIPLNEPAEVFGWIGEQFERVMRLVKSAERLLGGPNDTPPGVVQEALGPPGVSGNPSLLAYVARRIANVVEALMRWQMEFAVVHVPDTFSRILRITATIPVDAIAKLESIPDMLDSEIDKAEAAMSRGEHYVAKVVMVLATSVPDEFHTEMQWLRRSLFGV